jgi:hypothetical protein
LSQTQRRAASSAAAARISPISYPSGDTRNRPASATQDRVRPEWPLRSSRKVRGSDQRQQRHFSRNRIGGTTAHRIRQCPGLHHARVCSPRRKVAFDPRPTGLVRCLPERMAGARNRALLPTNLVPPDSSSLSHARQAVDRDLSNVRQTALASSKACQARLLPALPDVARRTICSQQCLKRTSHGSPCSVGSLSGAGISAIRRVARNWYAATVGIALQPECRPRS